MRHHGDVADVLGEGFEGVVGVGRSVEIAGRGGSGSGSGSRSRFRRGRRLHGWDRCRICLAGFWLKHGYLKCQQIIIIGINTKSAPYIVTGRPVIATPDCLFR